MTIDMQILVMIIKKVAIMRLQDADTGRLFRMYMLFETWKRRVTEKGPIVLIF